MEQKLIANQYLEETVSLKQNLEKNFLQLGQRLLKIRNDQLFLATHSSFVEFLWDLKITESTASKMINIYDHFVLELGVTEQKVLDAGGWTTAYKLKDLATTKSEAEEVLSLAATWSPKDLDAYIKEKKTGIEQGKCSHAETIDFRYCKVCFNKERIYDEQ